MTEKDQQRGASQNNQSAAKPPTVGEAIIKVTKDMVEHPSLVIKYPVAVIKNFDPIIFKIHAKKHPVKTAGLLAIGGIAVGAAAAIAVLAAPATVAIGGVGAVFLGAAAVTAGSVALTITGSKLAMDGRNTIKNLSEDEKRAYDEKVLNTWENKMKIASEKNAKTKMAKQRNAQRTAKIKAAATNIAKKFKIKSSKLEENESNQKPNISTPHKPDNTPKQKQSLSTQNKNQSFHL